MPLSLSPRQSPPHKFQFRPAVAGRARFLEMAAGPADRREVGGVGGGREARGATWAGRERRVHVHGSRVHVRSGRVGVGGARRDREFIFDRERAAAETLSQRSSQRRARQRCRCFAGVCVGLNYGHTTK